MQPSDPGFCACCEPPAPLAPQLISNRPGLSQIAWRQGSYASFRQAMLEMVARGAPDPLGLDDAASRRGTRAALLALTTRDDSDYAIMLIDLFAAVADVLAFYGERQANEMFLRTALQRDSLMRLVRVIGFHPLPGVAATTALAFTLDPGAALSLGKGLKVMSVPGQDEQPQIYETIAALAADARLNDLPVFGAPQTVDPFAQDSVSVAVTSLPDRLVAGDAVLLASAGAVELNQVAAIEVKPDGAYLVLTRAIGLPGNATVGFRLLRQFALFGHDLPAGYSAYDPSKPPASRWSRKTIVTDYSPALAAHQARYALDRANVGLKDGDLLLVDCGPLAAPRLAFARVAQIAQDAAAVGPLEGTVDHVVLQPVQPVPGSGSIVTLAGTGLPAIPDRRQVRIWLLDAEPIVPRTYDYPPAVSGQTVHVRSDHLDDATLLAKKRWISLVAGEVRHLARITSAAQLAAGPDGVSHITLGFEPALPGSLVGLSLNGNVAPASHGETQPDETLGHGDGSRSFQQFKLQRQPLTRIPAGRVDPEAELAVRVNGELWREVGSFYGQGPNERVYTVRTADDGTSTLRFGDGTTGARLPSGAANVVARYRKGLGLAGRVRAGQLSTLLARPPGLRSVTNPLPADGGGDPQAIEALRDDAPASVRTFGRAIVLGDFEAVARQTGLVARARANWAWLGMERAIQLTVSGPGGSPLTGPAKARLAEALNAVRDPNHLLIVCNLWRVPLVVEARLLRDPAFEADIVEYGARAVLDDFFAFEKMAIGRAVHLSQVAAVLQSARGVQAVDIDRFHFHGADAWTPAQLGRRGASAAAAQASLRIFDARPMPASGTLDPIASANLALDPDAPALSAEQAVLQASHVRIQVVEAL